MAIEAQAVQCGEVMDWTADGTYSQGDVIQLPDGRCGIVEADCVSGGIVGVVVEGIRKVLKTASIAILSGGRVFWDHSANKGHFKKANDRDFYMGRASADAAASDSYVYVDLNINPPADVDIINRDAALSVATGTQALGGFLPPQVYGNAKAVTLTATSEVQCVDMLSVDKFSVDAQPIAEFVFRPAANGSTSAVDFNVGLANGTSTSDADAVTEHVFAHVDGGSTAINAQSKDGTTTVAAVDTTKTISAGSAVANRTEVWIDARDKTSVKMYVDGVRVNSGSTFRLDNATGPLGLLVHLEKSTGTATAGPFYIDRAECRLSQ